MARAIIHDWTKASVQLKFDEHRMVQYCVYRDAGRHYLEMRTTDGEPIHTLELPDGMKLDQSSYEVLLRYVLLDVVAA
jgi:hypothetical protein